MKPTDELNRLPGEQIDRLKAGLESLREMFEAQTDAIRAKDELNSQLRAQITAIIAERDGMALDLKRLRESKPGDLSWIDTAIDKYFGCYQWMSIEKSTLRRALLHDAPISPAAPGDEVFVITEKSDGTNFVDGTVYRALESAIELRYSDYGCNWEVRRATLHIGDVAEAPEREKFPTNNIRLLADVIGSHADRDLLRRAADEIERLEFQLEKTGEK